MLVGSYDDNTTALNFLNDISTKVSQGDILIITGEYGFSYVTGDIISKSASMSDSGTWSVNSSTHSTRAQIQGLYVVGSISANSTLYLCALSPVTLVSGYVGSVDACTCVSLKMGNGNYVTCYVAPGLRSQSSDPYVIMDMPQGKAMSVTNSSIGYETCVYKFKKS